MVREILRYHAEGYDEMLDDLGQRAGVCMQDMILNGEPITQSELARRIGLRQQSAVAQPFSEMRRKYLLREDPAPHSAAKYAAFADRFLALPSAWSRRLGEADPLSSCVIAK